MQVRLIKAEDLPQCVEIVKLNWGIEIARSAVVELDQSLCMRPWRPVVYVADDKDEIKGCGGYIASWLHYGVYDITWINVHPKYQKQGVGKLIVNKCLSDIKSLGHLAMLSTTKPEYYSKNWEFKNLYKHGVDKTIMALDLC